MDALEIPLLSEGAPDDSAVMPALRKLLLLASSQDADKQAQAAIGISKVVERRSVDLSSFGPLCHILTRLVAIEKPVVAYAAPSEHQPVVTYAARSIKFLVLDDTLRAEATRAGIPSVLAAALVKRRGDTVCLREILGALQALCYDERTVLAVIDTGALGSVLELLDTEDVALRLLSTATLTNILSFSDTLLLSCEECINTVHDRMDIVVAAVKSQGGTDLAVAALANACAHRVLARRAKELGAPELLVTKLADAKGEHRFLTVAMARLKGHGDAEEGGHDGDERLSAHNLQFFRVKSRTHVRVQKRITCQQVVCWVAYSVALVVLSVGVFFQDW